VTNGARYFEIASKRSRIFLTVAIASQLFVLSLAIAHPLSALNQKTDSLCLPNVELLSLVIADPLSALANLVNLSCLLICVSLRGVANLT
jgi:hypothetical protein